MKFYIIPIILLFSGVFLAQRLPGARQIALSNSDVALGDDVFTLFNNPAGSAQFDWKEAGVFYSPAPYGLSELANGYAAYHHPVGNNAFSAGLMTYGFELYRETQIALSFAYDYNHKFFFGLTSIYHNLFIKNYGSGNTISFNFGILSYLTNHWRIGFLINNFTRSTIGSQANQIPIIFTLGTSYSLAKQIGITAEVEKYLDFSAAIRFGIEYSLNKYFDIRFGFSNQPNSLSGGCGINYSKFQIDYAVFTHQDLGLTHQFGLIIHFIQFKSRSSAIKQYLNKE